MKNEWADIDGLCTDGNVPSDPLLDGCLQNSKPDEVTKRIVVLGDSHAQQYMAALGPIAREPRLGSGHAAEGQLPFRRRIAGTGRRVQRLQQGQRRVRPGTPAGRRVHRGLADPRGSPVRNGGARLPGRHQAVHRCRHRVVGVRDNPRFAFNMPECVQKRRRRSRVQPAAERIPGRHRRWTRTGARWTGCT